MSNKMKNTLALLSIPVCLLVVALGLNSTSGGGSSKAKAKKHKTLTYAEAGADLQRSLGEGMKSQGYQFAVRACLHQKGDKYICAATIAGNEMGSGQCAVVSFTDTGVSKIEVTKVAAARDPKFCD